MGGPSVYLIMRMSLLRSLALTAALVPLLAATACDGRSPAAPTAGPAYQFPLPFAVTIPVLVEGRVFDSDREAPIPGALVVVDGADAPGGLSWPVVAAPATADANGAFALTASLLRGWRSLRLRSDVEGYETTLGIRVHPATARAAVLRLQPTLTLSAGNTIEFPVLDGLSGYMCGEYSIPCRRVVVGTTGAESLDVELEVVLGNERVCLWSTNDVYEGPECSRRLAVSGGSVWITGGPARVRLTAFRR